MLRRTFLAAAGTLPVAGLLGFKLPTSTAAQSLATHRMSPTWLADPQMPGMPRQAWAISDELGRTWTFSTDDRSLLAMLGDEWGAEQLTEERYSQKAIQQGRHRDLPRWLRLPEVWPDHCQHDTTAAELKAWAGPNDLYSPCPMCHGEPPVYCSNCDNEQKVTCDELRIGNVEGRLFSLSRLAWGLQHHIDQPCKLAVNHGETILHIWGDGWQLLQKGFYESVVQERISCGDPVKIKKWRE